jgi:hypothetical protein
MRVALLMWEPRAFTSSSAQLVCHHVLSFARRTGLIAPKASPTCACGVVLAALHFARWCLSGCAALLPARVRGGTGLLDFGGVVAALHLTVVSVRLRCSLARDQSTPSPSNGSMAFHQRLGNLLRGGTGLLALVTCSLECLGKNKQGPGA